MLIRGNEPGNMGKLPENNRREQDHQRLMNLAGMSTGKLVWKCLSVSKYESCFFLCKKEDVILLSKVSSLGSFHLKDHTRGYKSQFPQFVLPLLGNACSDQS